MKLFLLVALCALAMSNVAATADRDLHDYWDARCASCHGHAAQFARKFLSVEDGKLKGTHHRDNLDVFLRTHHLTPDLYAPTLAMLTAQAQSEPFFKQRCSACHGTAAEFARKSLEMKNDELYGKKSQKPVSEFLKNHFDPPPEEVRDIVETLKRVLSEVRTSARR
jgi:cytochrome c5